MQFWVLNVRVILYFYGLEGYENPYGIINTNATTINDNASSTVSTMVETILPTTTTATTVVYNEQQQQPLLALDSTKIDNDYYNNNYDSRGFNSSINSRQTNEVYNDKKLDKKENKSALAGLADYGSSDDDDDDDNEEEENGKEEVVIESANNPVRYYYQKAATSVRKATNQAIKNLQYFHRYNDRTIYHEIQYKFHSTKLKLMVRPPAAKVLGSRNGMNVVKATFQALETQKLPEDLAKTRGKKVVDLYHLAKTRGKKVVDLYRTYYGFSFTRLFALMFDEVYAILSFGVMEQFNKLNRQPNKIAGSTLSIKSVEVMGNLFKKYYAV
ncbi:9181_t:CDS:10 [Entrophospora sp. SA101]|nr:9181_t:CDS:10 [Entrophospora sp. SA101]